MTTKSEKTTIAELKLAASKYSNIREEIKLAIATLNPVEIVTPVNVAEEKKVWIENAKKGTFRNPRFIYNYELLNSTITSRLLLESLMQNLTSMKPTEDDIAESFVWEQLYSALSDGIDTTFLAEAIRDGKDNDAADIIVKKYGLPSDKNIGFALNVVLDNNAKNELEHTIGRTFSLAESTEKALTTVKLNATQIKEMFEWTMKDYLADSWSVVIDENCTSIDVRDKSQYGHPVIVIPTNRQVTGMKLAELIGHEIECHWRSSVNAESIGALKCDDELIYEGLAALKDKAFNRQFLGSFNLSSAYYVIAINEAIHNHSFADTAKLIYNYLPEIENREAKTWLYTYRVFRGITDTENKTGYAFTKDRAYFEGWIFAKLLEIHNETSYLSFSTLSRRSFDRFKEIIDIEDVEAHAVNDKNLQEKSIEKMARNLLYGNTQAKGLVTLMESIT